MHRTVKINEHTVIGFNLNAIAHDSILFFLNAYEVYNAPKRLSNIPKKCKVWCMIGLEANKCKMEHYPHCFDRPTIKERDLIHRPREENDLISIISNGNG